MGQVGESTVLDSPTKKKHDNFIMEKKNSSTVRNEKY